MISTIRSYASIGLAFLSIVLWALLNVSHRKAAQKKLKVAIQTRKTESKVNKATVEGLQNERNSKDNRNYDDDSII